MSEFTFYTNIRLVNKGDHPSKGRIHLGLMCINNTLRDKDIFCSRSMIRRTFNVQKAKEMALQNIKDISKLILWNNEHDIFNLRISSEIFPHFTDTDTEPYTLDFAKEELKKVGELAKNLGHRLTFHPGQFNQVGANKKEVLESTIKDLGMHCDIFDMMELDDNAIVNIHLGGMYGDKEKTKRRWIEQFDDLPSKIKRRLTIENDEKCYSVRDCLDVAAETGIPVVLDNHHYQCYNLLHPDEEPEEIEELITEVIEDSWRDRKVLFHISEQDETKKCGAHSKYISKLPDYYIEIPEKYDVDLWIDIEAKEKEKAVLKLYDTHPEIFKF